MMIESNGDESYSCGVYLYAPCAMLFLTPYSLRRDTLRYFMDTRAIEGGDWAVNSVGLTPSVATRAIRCTQCLTWSHENGQKRGIGFSRAHRTIDPVDSSPKSDA